MNLLNKDKFIPQFEPRIKFKYCWDVFRQMRSGWVGDGETVKSFESMLQQIVGVDFAYSTTSGTTALMLAIKALELPIGSTILFPAYTFIAGANAARFLGYNIRLVDIKEDTLSIDPSKMKIDDNVSAVMFVNHNGYHGGDLQKIKDTCVTHGIKLIEDASQCLGIPGNFHTGDVSVVSFSVPKLITTGQGGAVFTNDPKIAQNVWRLRNHGEEWRKTKTHNHLGANFKFDEIHASYGLSQLKDMEDVLSKKKKIFDWYRDRIEIYDFGYDITWMVLYKDNKEKIDNIIFNLKQNSVQSLRYYKPINWNPPYSDSPIGSFPVSEKVYDEILYIPSSLVLTQRDVDKICKIIKSS